MATGAETLGGLCGALVDLGRRRGVEGSAGVSARDVSGVAAARPDLAAMTAGVGVTAARAISSATLGGAGLGRATDFIVADGAGRSIVVEPETTEDLDDGVDDVGVVAGV